MKPWTRRADEVQAASGRFLTSATVADYAPNIAAFIAAKCGIIVTVGSLMADATEAAARAHPRQRFAIMDCSYRSRCLTGKRVRNIDRLTFSTVQDGFLGGYLAAGQSKTHVVATYGGRHIGTVTIYMDGFWDGVQYYDRKHHADVKVLGWNERTQKGDFIGNFTDLTGGCVSATPYCRHFLTSVTKGIARAARAAVLAAASGAFRMTYTGILANGGVALAPYHGFARKIPATLQAEITTLRSQIESGRIVPATKSPV